MKETRMLHSAWAFFGIAATTLAGDLVGHLRDPNWYARYQSQPVGVGYYEFGINANGGGLESLGGAASTDVFGGFQMRNLPAGLYTVVSWDVWWRSAYAFNVSVPASGATADLDLRLSAAMWGYPAFWDNASSYYEIGQTFAATGPVTMIYLRDPLNQSFTRTVTIHEGTPGGSQVGDTRTYGGGGDQRLIYGYGQMPTVAGRTYYVRVRTPNPTFGGVLRQMDPRPDFSDPMPGGCLWQGNGTTLTPVVDRDLGLVILCDDDGLLTNLYARQSGGSFSSVTNVGQTFIARGVGLISAAFWLADPAWPTYVVRVLRNGPGGTQVGTAKRGKPPRVSADPEMIVAWAPGECPLTPGETYYLEVTREGGGMFYSVYANTGNPFAYGQAYQNGTPVAGTDLAGTIMEEATPGSAARRALAIDDLAIDETGRGTNQVALTWRTPVPADSTVEYAPEAPPYSLRLYDPALVTMHRVTVTGLLAHTLYHFRASSATTNSTYRTGVSRDIVTVTKPVGTNLLANPDFEQGTGTSPRANIPGWSKSGLDIQASSGNWFGSLMPAAGAWLCQGAANVGDSDGILWQCVSGVVTGQDYNFSAAVLTAPRENDTWKYDVWQDPGRLIYMRLGVDPAGGTDPNAGTVQWTPRMYSHRHYTRLSKRTVAQSTNLTVFVRMQGAGVQWHLYGVDDCALTHEEVHPRLAVTGVTNNRIQMRGAGKPEQRYGLEYATNVLQWWPLGASYASGNGQFEFSVPGVTNQHHRFFRLRQTP